MPIIDIMPRGAFGSICIDPNSKTPYSDATQCRKKLNRSHVRRPMNAFMVYAQQERNRILEFNPNLHNAEISKNLGKKWKQMSGAEKKPFMDEAERLKLLHQLEFPEYKYRPKKRGRSRSTKSGVPRTTRSLVSSKDSKSSRAEQNDELTEQLLSKNLNVSQVSVEKTTGFFDLSADGDSCSRLDDPVSPQSSCGAWVHGVNDCDPNSSTDDDPRSTVELLPEDILYLLTAPTAVNSSERSSRAPFTGGRCFHLRSLNDDNNNISNKDFFSDGCCPENSIYGDIPDVGTFCDVTELNGSNTYFTDLQFSTTADDFPMDFRCSDESLALYPFESTGFLSEMPDLDDILDFNPDLLQEFSKFTDVVRDDFKLLF